MFEFEAYFKIIFSSFYEPKNVLPISLIIFIFTFITSSYDIESARSVLNVIIQTLASILAIVISLTLIALQLSSQNYSSRIIKMFVSSKNHYFWILMFLYLFTIIYSLFLLNSLIEIDDSGLISTIYVICTDLSILFAIWSLMLLPKYILNTLDSLEPQNIILELVKKINENSVKDIEKLSNDSLMPITDLINRSIENGHSDIAELAIKKMHKKLLKFIEIENSTDILNYYLDQMGRICETAISNSNEKILGLTIDCISEMSMIVIKKDFDAHRLLNRFYEHFSTKIIEPTFYDPIDKILNFFDEEFIPFLIISTTSKPNDFLKPVYIANSMKILNNMWKTAAEKRLTRIRDILGSRINYTIKKVAQSGWYAPINSEIDFLAEFGIWSIKYDPSASFLIIESLFTVFEGLSNQGFKKALDNSHDQPFEKTKFKKLICKLNKSLKNIGLESIRYDVYNLKGYFSPFYNIPIINFIKSYLKYINNDVYKKKSYFDEDDLNTMSIGAIFYLKEIGIKLIDKNPKQVIDLIMEINSFGIPNKINQESIMLEILESLNELEMKIIDNGFNTDISIGINFISDISIYSIKNDFLETLSNSNRYLKTIALNLTCQKELIGDLSNSIKCIEYITIEAIFENNSKETVLSFASILKDVSRKLKLECSDETNLNLAINSLSEIKKHLDEANMMDSAKEIQKWLNESENS